MKPFIALTCALFLANSILADPYSAAIRQAKDVSGKVTDANRRLLDNPPPAAPPQNNPNPPTDPVLLATLKNIENLRHDFAALASLTNIASITKEKQGLTNDLATAAQGVKPSQQSLSKLADDLAAAIAGNAKLRPQHTKLAQYIHAISNSSHLTATQQQMVFSDMQVILVNGGAAPDDATSVVNDIKTIASETK